MINSIFLSTDLSRLNFESNYVLRSAKDENGRTFIELKKFDFKNSCLNLFCLGKNDPQTLGLIEYFKAWFKISEFAIPTIKKTVKKELSSLQRKDKIDSICRKNINYLNSESQTTGLINSLFSFLNNSIPRPTNQIKSFDNLSDKRRKSHTEDVKNPNTSQKKLDLIKKGPYFPHLSIRLPKSIEKCHNMNMKVFNIKNMKDQYILSAHAEFNNKLFPWTDPKHSWWKLSFNEQKAYNKRFENLGNLSPKRFSTYLDVIKNPKNWFIRQNGTINQPLWNHVVDHYEEVLDSVSTEKNLKNCYIRQNRSLNWYFWDYVSTIFCKNMWDSYLRELEKLIFKRNYYQLCFYMTSYFNNQPLDRTLNNPWWGNHSLQEQQELNAQFAEINLTPLPTHSDLIKKFSSTLNTMLYRLMLCKNNFKIWDSLEYLDQKKMLKVFEEKNLNPNHDFKITRKKPSIFSLKEEKRGASRFKMALFPFSSIIEKSFWFD